MSAPRLHRNHQGAWTCEPGTFNHERNGTGSRRMGDAPADPSRIRRSPPQEGSEDARDWSHGLRLKDFIAVPSPGGESSAERRFSDAPPRAMAQRQVRGYPFVSGARPRARTMKSAPDPETDGSEATENCGARPAAQRVLRQHSRIEMFALGGGALRSRHARTGRRKRLDRLIPLGMGRVLMVFLSYSRTPFVSRARSWPLLASTEASR